MRYVRYAALACALVLASAAPALADSDQDVQVMQLEMQHESFAETAINNFADAWSEMQSSVTDNMNDGGGGGCCDWGSGWGW